MEELGLTEADYSAHPVWPENMPYVTLLQLMRTQWQLVVGATRGVYMGLNYACLPPIARAVGIDLDSPAAWVLIQRAESAAKAILNAK